MLPDHVRLDWLPKSFGPGDLDGDGWLKLLGKPDIDRANLLVRETAQNSWDARDKGRVPLFEMHLRTLDPEQTEILRRQVFTGDAAPNLGAVMAHPTVRVLEISDRGTHGLRGPVRNDRTIRPGTPTDFIDFVLGVGAPPDDPKGGGSYGFGKVATYMASGVGTMLIWSRTAVDEGLEDRLIGSAIGPSFEKDGIRFTGRHWWGIGTAREDGGPVQPLRGEPAASLGSAVFSRGFEPGETGTSLMLIDPRWDDAEDDRGLIDNWATAIRRNLWPKLVRGDDDSRRMDIRLLHEGREVDLLANADSRLKAYERCLAAVRAAQAGMKVEDGRVRVHEVRCERPAKLVGHVALTRYLRPESDDDLTHHVCLMRNEAELVLRYVDHPKSDDDQLAWAGVFKPVAELDPVYARSEPPAHDDWVSKSMPNRTERTLVNTCFTKVRGIVRDFLAPRTMPVDSAGQVPVGDLSFALAALAGTAPGSRPLTVPNKNRASRGPGRPRKQSMVTVDRAVPMQNPEHEQRVFRLDLSIQARGKALLGTRRLAWAVEGGHEQDEDGQLGGPPEVTCWTLNPGTSREVVIGGEGPVEVGDGDHVRVDVIGVAGRTLDVDFSLEEPEQ